MKIKIEGEKLLFIDFPFKTKEVGISFINSGVAIYDETNQKFRKLADECKSGRWSCVDSKGSRY